MNTRVMLIGVMLLAVVPGFAQATEYCTITFDNSEEDDLWQDANNWDTNVLPEEDDVVCIPSGELAVIQPICNGGTNDGEFCENDTDCPGGACEADEDVKAGALKILGTTGDPGDTRVYISGLASLKLYGYYTCDGGTNDGLWCDPTDPDCPSGTCVEDEESKIIEGSLHVNLGGAKLVIVNDLTIEGEESLIEGEYVNLEYSTRGRIEAASGTNAVLTLDSTYENPDYPENWLCVIEAPDIAVELVNDAYILANREEGLRLSGAKKSGSGYWAIGTKGGSNGLLIVDTEVEGSGTWLLGVAGTIEINQECSDLTGDVEISSGTLDINEYFCTSGNIEMTGGQITVAAGKEASFD
jgi:hypothetical protein